MSDLEHRISRIEYWRDGNGARGAEARIQNVEQRMERFEDEYVEKDSCLIRQGNLEQRIIAAVKEAMNGGKSLRQWLQVLAPYAAVGVSLYIAMRGGK